MVFDKNKKITQEKERKILASEECCDKISAMEKGLRLKHKRKLELFVNKIKNKLYSGLG